MRTLLIVSAFAVLILLGACHPEEKTCPPQAASDMSLQPRIDSLNQREAALNAREQAIAAREAAIQGNGGTGTSGSTAASTNGGTDGENMHAASKNRRQTEDPAALHKASRYSTPGEYPEASERLLADKDVQFLTAWGAKMMVNEIYARHGMSFTDPDLRKHFRAQSWYKGDKKNVDKMLTPTERQNIAFVHEHMEKAQK